MIKGVIFDNDGVVIDSNHIHYENWNNVFQTKFKIVIPKDEFASRLGESARHFTEYFIWRYSLKTTYDELHPEIMAYYGLNSSRIVLKPGITEVLPILRKHYRIALATGANREWAMTALSRLGIEKYFDFIIGGDQVKRAKPDPEIFLKAAEGLGLKPEECVVVEDALMGITAAKAAGMKAISIPDEFTRIQDHSIADVHLKSAKELTPELIRKI